VRDAAAGFRPEIMDALFCFSGEVVMLRRTLFTAVQVCGVVLFPPIMLAQSSTQKDQKGTGSDVDEIQKLVTDLASEQFQTREEAQRMLVALGSAALPELQKALRSRDLEVRVRANSIIKEIEKLHAKQFLNSIILKLSFP
jgi:hypothetical protein